MCRQQYTVLRDWVTMENDYRAALALAKKNHKSTNGIPKPGPQPPKASAFCPPSTVFGLAASALVPTATRHS
jgi:hypothetical protein